MKYSANFIEGKTIEELKEEIKKMENMQYRYGYIIDKQRLWDIEHTISILLTY